MASKIERDDALVRAAGEAAIAATAMVRALGEARDLVKGTRKRIGGDGRAVLHETEAHIGRVHKLVDDYKSVYTALPAKVAELIALSENIPNVSRALGHFRKDLNGMVGSRLFIENTLAMAKERIASVMPDEGLGPDDVIGRLKKADEALTEAAKHLAALVEAAPKVTKNIEVSPSLLDRIRH